MILQGALNRLLGHTPAAQAVLRPFSGRNVRIETPLKSATLVITEDGYFGSTVAEPEATLRLPLSFFIIRTHSPVAAARQIESAGMEDLCTGVSQALSLVRWDAAEDLSVLIGDVLAHRLIKLATIAGGIPGAIGGRLLLTFTEYWRDEAPLLPRAEQMDSWRDAVTQLRDELAALERRIAELE